MARRSRPRCLLALAATARGVCVQTCQALPRHAGLARAASSFWRHRARAVCERYAAPRALPGRGPGARRRGPGVGQRKGRGRAGPPPEDRGQEAADERLVARSATIERCGSTRSKPSAGSRRGLPLPQHGPTVASRRDAFRAVGSAERGAQASATERSASRSPRQLRWLNRGR